MSTGGGHSRDSVLEKPALSFALLLAQSQTAHLAPDITQHATQGEDEVRGDGDRADFLHCLGKPMQLLGLADFGLESFHTLSRQRLSSQHLERVKHLPEHSPGSSTHGFSLALASSYTGANLIWL